MISVIKHQHEEWKSGREVSQFKWSWIVLLIVLGYEAAGCLTGGILLIVAPDGRLMDMPVDLMHGVFDDFLIPGFILFALGLLTTAAFIFVLSRNALDWIMSALSLGALAIWFVVEIIIIRELHWLHLMWGAPVFLGYVVALPLFVSKYTPASAQKILFICGILSTLWYVAVNIIVPEQWDSYSVITQTVSELSAIGAPTRQLWVLLVIFYPFLLAAFGWGLWLMAGRTSALRIMGSLVVIYSVFNFYWPPMHQRDVIAAGGGTLTDTLHLVWASVTLILMLALMGFGTVGKSKAFRLYTIVTWIVFIACGTLTFMEAPAMQANRPTPLIGAWERINIAAFMVWIAVFASLHLIRLKKIEPTR